MKLDIFTDGGSRGNPGPAAAGVVIKNKRGQKVFARGFYLGHATNNVAEYEGVLYALHQAKKLGATELVIHSDSELLVRQINGQYKVKNPRLKELYQSTRQLLAEFSGYQVKHVRREYNTLADGLVNQALDIRADVGGESEDIADEIQSAISTIDLTDKIDFDPLQPCCEFISRDDKVKTELICLDVGQCHPVNLKNCSGGLLVVEGAGSFKCDDQSQAINKNTWVSFDHAFKAQITADANQQLVVLLTLW